MENTRTAVVETAEKVRKKGVKRESLLKRGKRAAVFLLIGMVLGAAVFYGASRAVQSMLPPPEPQITSDTIVEQVVHVQELVTSVYHYKNVGELRDQKDFQGIPIPFTDRRIIYTFKGTIKVGVDVGEIAESVKVDQEGKVVTMTIPKGKIIAHVIPSSEVKPFDESVSLFSSFKMDDYSQLLAGRQAEIEREFLAENYLAEAQEEARRVLTALLSNLPGMDEYTLDIQLAT